MGVVAVNRLVDAEENGDDLMAPVDGDEDGEDDEEGVSVDEPTPPLPDLEGNTNSVQSNVPSRLSQRDAAVNARSFLRDALGVAAP